MHLSITIEEIDQNYKYSILYSICRYIINTILREKNYIFNDTKLFLTTKIKAKNIIVLFIN